MATRSGGARFFIEPVEFLLLPNIGREGNDFRVMALDEPLENDGGVEPSGVGE